jgi:prepilin-type N-terminal cleavage/methylation domain-containing protein
MKSKGFTLIELAVVLAVIAILAAVLEPMVVTYIEQGRIARAQADLRTIADAIKLYQRDTGQWPVYASSGNYTANPQVIAGSKTLIGGSNGGNPGNGTASPAWAVSSNIATAALETYLNGNNTGVSTTNPFPKRGFNGPYIGNMEMDPWGNKYLLTAADLAGTTNHAYVISAGPNGMMDTTLDQSVTGTFTIGGDDVVEVIR